MTDILEESSDGEIVDVPVKPGTIRIILADSQRFIVLAFARSLRSKTICA